ncbi:MAG: type II toxin-antitoxin system HipA family toxin [Flavobacteriales bacterium]
MVTSIAEVKLWGKTLGAVAWDSERSLASFEFVPEYDSSLWDIAPLTMPRDDNQRIFSFPNLNRETYHGLPGLLADSLPDRFGSALLDAWLAKQGRAEVNPVERLCYIGRRGMGALEFEPAQEALSQEMKSLEIDAIVSLAQDILNERKTLSGNLSNHPNETLSDIIRIGTSAGGARAKAVIAYNRQTGEVKSGQLDLPEGFEHYILKLDGVTNDALGDPKGYGRIEYAYYLMAKAAGITMMESQLLEEGERAHFLTKRFDRVDNQKLHMQTLCGIAHYDYNQPSLYAYEQAFQVMRRLRLPYPDAEELFRRMVFNVMAKNRDDHTKNIAFLMDRQGKWSLAPAYDVTFAFDPMNKWMSVHQLSVNGKREHITTEDFLMVAKAMNIKKAHKIIDQVSGAVFSWNEFANAAEIPENQASEMQRMIKL